MKYDVQIRNTIRRGLTYAELIACPIYPNTFIRRNNAKWMQAKDCVELTHILAQLPAAPSAHTTTISQTDINDYTSTELDENEFDHYQDEEDEIVKVTQNTRQNQITSVQSAQHFHIDEVVEERIFIPTAEYFKCNQKRKAAIIGVCSLGLAGLSLMGVGNTWRCNIFTGTSFSANAGIGFVFKCLSFCLLTGLIAIPYFIYSVFALVYYSIRLNNLKH